MDEAALVAVADVAPDLVAWSRGKYAVKGYTSFRQMLAQEALDAVVVAVPTRDHLPVGLAVLERGLHVLVEKPIAVDLVEAETLLAAAADRECILAVGHIERFNAAIRQLKLRIARGELGRIFKVHARRCGPFPTRIRDVGVVVDLATHDLDIMAYLLGTDVVRLFAETARRIHTDHEDMLTALLRFDNGIVGVLDVDWLTPTKVRDISVLGERGLFHVDYLSQELTLYENSFTNGQWDAPTTLSGVTEGNMTRFHVDRAEPLRLELTSFMRAVSTGGQPDVTGEDGIRALRLALELVSSGRSGQPVQFMTRASPLVEVLG
jgi:predicted dehydrogenase